MARTRRQEVWDRAGGRCDYCRMPQEFDDWEIHFDWHGPLLMARTSIGRTTIDVLRINAPDRVAHRQLLIEAGVFSPGVEE